MGGFGKETRDEGFGKADRDGGAFGETARDGRNWGGMGGFGMRAGRDGGGGFGEMVREFRGGSEGSPMLEWDTVGRGNLVGFAGCGGGRMGTHSPGKADASRFSCMAGETPSSSRPRNSKRLP